MARRKSSGNRTRKGNVTSKARKRFGTRGKFPVFDRRSAMSALKLRGRGKGISRKSVINKVSRWASAHNDTAVKAAVKRARKADAKR